MAEPRLIRDYRAALSRQLPAPIAEEVAGGLTETYQACLRRDHAPDIAARSAIAEFGDPQLIVAEFTRASPARRAARRLLATGPAAGACWAAALVTSQAQAWPVPLAARVLLGLTLAAVVTMFTIAALGTRYQLAIRTALAGCVGITALDIAMITGVLLAAPAITWITAAAIAVSTARIIVSTRAVRPLLAR